MKSRNSLWMLATISSTVAGCAATIGVQPAAQNAYHVNVIGARYETQADANLRALTLANQYCDQMGKHVMFRQSTETSEHAWSPKQEDLTFICMDAEDPAYMRAAGEHASPVVAKQD